MKKPPNIPQCCICRKQNAVACIIEGHICERCATETLPRLLATFVCTYTETLNDPNLTTARADEYFERFSGKFWRAVHHFRTHRAAK
jgi:hypothetical protein